MSGAFATSYAVVKDLFFGAIADTAGVRLDEEARRRKARKTREDRGEEAGK